MKAIVTVKLNWNPHPNSKDKKAGKCPLSDKLGIYLFCTDIKGNHHSYIEEGLNLEEIEKKAEAKFGHVTRIEVADEGKEVLNSA